MELEKWVSDNGDIFWYKRGTNISHKEDGPAIEWKDGSKTWMMNNSIHRLDGPAIELSDGKRLWYYDGIYIACQDQETFERILKLKAFW